MLLLPPLPCHCRRRFRYRRRFRRHFRHRRCTAAATFAAAAATAFCCLIVVLRSPSRERVLAYRCHEGAAQVCEGTARAPKSARVKPESAQPSALPHGVGRLFWLEQKTSVHGIQCTLFVVFSALF
jgi:hypothetical protein